MFTLSNRSAKRLDGVHPLLVSCVVIALRRYSEIDFGVAADAVRTLGYQKKLVSAGRSKTMKSKHLIQSDGFSHAVDIYPSGFGKIELITDAAWAHIVAILDMASEEVGIELTHGWNYTNRWDKPHHEIRRIL